MTDHEKRIREAICPGDFTMVEVPDLIATLADLDAMRGALERVDADWSSFWPLGPDVPSSSDRVCAIAPETAEIWRAIRAALKGASA